MKKTFSTAYKTASKELAREMSRQLTHHAINDGWDREVAAGLSVNYDHGSFSTSHNPKHSAQVFDLEYGTETSAPKGTIRKMHASKGELADRFAKLIERSVKKI